MSTQLTYDIVPDKSPLYTTVDQLNQSTADLQVTAQNSTHQPVTISEILIELMKVEQGADKVQLLLPGSASGIQFPNNVTGPGQTTWTVTNPNDGQFLIKSDGGSATFQAGDTLSLTLQNVVIREGGTGTAFVPIHEASAAGRGETEVGIGITQSTLDVQLSSDAHMVEPGGSATLTWTTTDATSGTLVLPGNSPNSMTIPSTSLASGQQQVWPIGDTTYSLSCQGLGPNVTAEVPVNVDSLQMGELESSAEIVHVSGELLLRWQTNADSCTLDDGSGNAASPVPPTVPSTDYPNGYPFNPKTPTTYTVHGNKQLSNHEFVDDKRSKSIQVYPVQLTNFSSSANAFDASETITLSWNTVDAVSCALSTQEGSGSVSVPVANNQTATCNVGATPDGQTLIVTTADGSNQELGRLTLPSPCPNAATFKLSAAGVSPQQSTCVVTLMRPQIDYFMGIVVQAVPAPGVAGGYAYQMMLNWSTSHAGSVKVASSGLNADDPKLTAPFFTNWFGTLAGSVLLACQGFGGPITESHDLGDGSFPAFLQPPDGPWI